MLLRYFLGVFLVYNVGNAHACIGAGGSGAGPVDPDPDLLRVEVRAAARREAGEDLS